MVFGVLEILVASFLVGLILVLLQSSLDVVRYAVVSQRWQSRELTTSSSSVRRGYPPLLPATPVVLLSFYETALGSPCIQPLGSPRSISGKNISSCASSAG